MNNNDLSKFNQKENSIYSEIFIGLEKELVELLNSQKARLECKSCSIYSSECKHFPQKPTQKLPRECIFRFWQENCLEKLEKEITPKIGALAAEINKIKEKYSCQKCGACCRLASSELSFERLKSLAALGDAFARQFISLFVPYENKTEARQYYPEFFDMLEEKYGKTNALHYYHCKKLTSDNLCGDYANRLGICRDFPNNPLVVFPNECGYKKWQNEVYISALTLHAMINITEFYKEKISKALNEPASSPDVKPNDELDKGFDKKTEKEHGT